MRRAASRNNNLPQPFTTTARIADALGVPPSDLMAAQTASIPLGDMLIEALAAVGMNTDAAAKIRRHTSTRVQRAILRAVTMTTEDGQRSPGVASMLLPRRTEEC